MSVDENEMKAEQVGFSLFEEIGLEQVGQNANLLKLARQISTFHLTPRVVKNEYSIGHMRRVEPRVVYLKASPASEEKSDKTAARFIKRLSRAICVVTPPKIHWPKDYHWETGNLLWSAMDALGFFPPQLKERWVWNPCFLDGECIKVFKRLNFKNFIHVNRNLWDVWPKTVHPSLSIVTNPPYEFKWLSKFYDLLTALDLPFVIIQSGNITATEYFGKRMLEQICRPQELHVVGLEGMKFPMLKKFGDGKAGIFSGLVVVAYFPAAWNWSLNPRFASRGLKQTYLRTSA